MSAQKRIDPILLEFHRYRKSVSDELASQLRDIESLQPPKLHVIDPLDVNDPVFRQKPKEIHAGYPELPDRDRQVIYKFSMYEQFKDADDLREFIKELNYLKKAGSEEHTQITGVVSKRVADQIAHPEHVTLYVGTSRSFVSRLQQHIGHGSRGTATILLGRWPSLVNGNKKITLEVYDFGENVKPETLKLLESMFSDTLKPLIGHNRKS